MCAETLTLRLLDDGVPLVVNGRIQRDCQELCHRWRSGTQHVLEEGVVRRATWPDLDDRHLRRMRRVINERDARRTHLQGGATNFRGDFRGPCDSIRLAFELQLGIAEDAHCG